MKSAAATTTSVHRTTSRPSLGVKLFDRYFVQELAAMFLAGVVLFAGFIWVAGGPLLNAINDLAKGVPIYIVAQLAGLFLPPMLVLAFPMAMLIAVIMAFSRLSSDSEAVALFAAGVSFYRMLLPTAVFALAVTLIGLLVNNSIIPDANRRINYIKSNVTHELVQTAQPIDLPPQRNPDGTLRALVHVEGGFAERTQALQGVTIIEFDSSGTPAVMIYAKSAQWVGGNNWKLMGVHSESAGKVVDAPEASTGDIAQTPDAMASLATPPDNFSFRQLARHIARLRAEGYGSTPEIREAEVNLWDKIALPCASFVFALVAAPLALKPQRGSSRGAATTWGIAIILCYYALFKYLDVLGANGHVDPILAAFLPNILGVLLAGGLVARVRT